VIKGGVVYMAYGANACREAKASIASLRRYCHLPVAVIGEPLDVKGITQIAFDVPKGELGTRWAKLNLDIIAPAQWRDLLYLDADTQIEADVSGGFAFLADGWDLAVALSANQGGEVFHHIGAKERQETIEELGDPFPLQLQAGVMFFNRDRCARLFAAWREEWLKFKDQDQAALIRALQKCPVRVWLLGYPWNNSEGSIVKHLFGRAR